MEPGLVICKGDWSESTNECEISESGGVFLGNFQLEPDAEMWKEFWSEIQYGP